jgi:hypothetical protein
MVTFRQNNGDSVLCNVYHQVTIYIYIYNSVTQESEVSSPYLQETATCPYAEPTGSRLL